MKYLIFFMLSAPVFITELHDFLTLTLKALYIFFSCLATSEGLINNDPQIFLFLSFFLFLVSYRLRDLNCFPSKILAI